MDFEGHNAGNPIPGLLADAWRFVEDYGFYLAGVGLLGYVAYARLAAWSARREKQDSLAAALDPERTAALDARRTAAFAARHTGEQAEADRAAAAERERAEEAKLRAEKIERYDNLMNGKSNKTTGSMRDGYDHMGGGGGGDDDRPSYARRRPNCSGGG